MHPHHIVFFMPYHVLSPLRPPAICFEFQGNIGEDGRTNVAEGSMR